MGKSISFKKKTLQNFAFLPILIENAVHNSQMQTDRSTIDQANKLNQHILSGRAVIYAKDNAIFGQIN